MAEIRESMFHVPAYIMFIQKAKKYTANRIAFVDYELFICGKMVFSCTEHSLQECMTSRNKWLKENRS